MNEIMTMRTELANQFAAAGAELLDFTMTAGALAAIPNTVPQQYAVAGTLETILAVMPAEAPSHPQRRQKHGDRPSAEDVANLFGDEAAHLSEPAVPAVGSALVAPTEEQIIAAARVLSDRSATACNVNKLDNWDIYGGEFIDDARAALTAAFAASQPIPTKGNDDTKNTDKGEGDEN